MFGVLGVDRWLSVLLVCELFQRTITITNVCHKLSIQTLDVRFVMLLYLQQSLQALKVWMASVNYKYNK